MNLDALPRYNPDRELCIDALLACAFARSQKMMRFISAQYDTNKDFFYKSAQKSDHFNSRFITGSRNSIRLNAIQSLGIIMTAKDDTELNKAMLLAAEKAFKKIANKVASFKDRYVDFGEVLDSIGVFDSGEDDLLHDTMGLILFFCQQYKSNINAADPMYQQVHAVITDKDEAFLRPFSDIVKEVAAEHSHNVADLMKSTFLVCGNSKTVADLGSRLDINSDEFAFFQIMWDIAQLDNLPMSSYENEKFTKQELTDLFNTMYIHIIRGDFKAEDVNKYYVAGLILRSFARLYKESSAIIDQYAGIIRESDRFQELQRELSSMTHKANEMARLNAERQEQLNILQIEHDKQGLKNAVLQEEVEALKERIAILESLEDDKVEVTIPDEKLVKARKLKGVVFGGPPNWQSSLKEAAPNFTCIPVEDKDFDTKIIDKTEVIVIKTDYLSHAQWYRVVKRAKSKGKKIVYCKNNIELIFSKIAELL